jgi:uncharacterized protein YbbC (DUF1343 family)
MPEARFGIDGLIRAGAVPRSARLGLVTNDAARVAADVNVTSRVALRDAGFNLVRLFGPEHGIGASAADGAHVPDGVDPLTRLPVVSLYGQTQRPARVHLDDLDLILFDIPDVGARFYTYIWTLSHVLEACAEARRPLVVLDRPNPIGGDVAACEGPMLDEARFSTFVGRWNIPIRHGLTVGELATLWNAERRIGADLRVIPVEGWTRDMHWPDTALPFVPTSPAMPDYATALAYPGTCLFEGTNLTEGRGTDAPFRTIGAPWVDGRAVAEQFNARNLAGVRAEPTQFTPAGRKYADEICQGVRLRIEAPRAFRPVAAALQLLAIMIDLHGNRFSWSPYPTAANESGGGHFDRLAGTSAVRELLPGHAGHPTKLIEGWARTVDWWTRVVPHLLYG